MLIEVIVKDLPYVGPKGTVKNIPDNEAEVHLALGTVKRAEKPEPRRRTYRRKDVRPVETVVVAPVEPVIPDISAEVTTEPVSFADPVTGSSDE